MLGDSLAAFDIDLIAAIRPGLAMRQGPPMSRFANQLLCAAVELRKPTKRE
jgi:hypothetical protein